MKRPAPKPNPAYRNYVPPVAKPHQATRAQLLDCAKWHDSAASKSTARREVHMILAQKLRNSAALAA